MNQYAAPHFLPDQDGKPISLERLAFGGIAAERGYDERWLQDLLLRCPSLLPTQDVDRAYKDLIPVCRELPTDAGPIDLVYVTADGGIVLVETKLWQNPEARRAVVVQILDYAKELSQWDYDRFAQATQGKLDRRAASLYQLVASHHPEVTEKVFSDGIGRCLRSRRYDLLLSLGVAGMLLVVSSTLLYLAEGRLQPEAFGSIPRAMWWSIATLTTVGYGDVYPVTAMGQVFAAITAITGIGLIAIPTGILAAAFSDAMQRHKTDRGAG